MNPLLTKKAPVPHPGMLKALNSFPIFGGEDPVTPAGGSPATPDPVAELAKDPVKLAQLLQQTTDLTNKVAELTTTTQTLQSENESYKTAETEAQRAQQSKEEQQATDIDNYKAQVEKLTNILNVKLVENAIANNPQYQWNSTRQAQAELDASKIKVNIDIDKGIAEIDGMDAELKRIADSSPWLLKATTEPQAPAGPAPQRPGGRAPQPPAPRSSKSELHEKAMKRYPALQGMGITPK